MIVVDYKSIMRLYEYMNGRVMGFADWRFIPTDKDDILVQKFLAEKSLNPSYVKGYFSYQFYYWSYGKRKFKGVMLSWVIGKKAMSRYKDARDYASSLSYLIQHFGIDNSIVDDILGIKNRGIKVSSKSMKSIEDEWRRAAYGTELGFANCIDYTSLYQDDNSLCQSCINKEKCITIKDIND